MSHTQGLFGKMPQLGDFLRHRLPQDWTDPWHTWLQTSLTVSQEQLGPQWQPCFCTAQFGVLPYRHTPCIAKVQWVW
ncbi:MAG: type VI secretion system-associated protein TagF [Limnobacter sp.]|nr:type VI secretion system-associated protein TagF [Limnobacter sp.]